MRVQQIRGLIARIFITSIFSATAFAGVAEAEVFQAGAYAMNVNPTKLPVIVNGGFREKSTDTILDPMRARCLVMDDGTERIAIVVVDSCMVPRDLLDKAKALASKATGIRADRMLISSTHTHSAPSAMGALGSSADPNYIKELPGMIAEGIKRANERLQPARVGWAAVDAPEHTNCRRWILRSDKMRTDPFGERTVRAHMHPGHQNPDFIGPSGPVDTGLTLLSLQTAKGKPLAMFANFSMHYYGSGALSADYCGAFSEAFAKLIDAGDGASDFVAAMSQGTSGDLQWMDYSQPRPSRDVRQYSAELAAIARDAYARIEHKSWAPLAMAEAKLKLRRRVADEKRLAWARKVVAAMGPNKPVTQQQIYAREQVLIAESPERELILQAARVGDLGLTAIPNEVYSITGLKLKAQSPLQPTMNIELANGGEGYIPSPEQHRLGGYTTWEARTASLETNAEPKIVETLLTLLEKVADKPRRKLGESHGKYTKAVLDSKPLAYWRMGELEGEVAKDSSGNGNDARLTGLYAFGLDGADGAGMLEAPGHSKLKRVETRAPGRGIHSASTPDPGRSLKKLPDALRKNRAIQFVSGTLEAKLPAIKGDHTIEFWFWNGLPASVAATSRVLFSQGSLKLWLLRHNETDDASLTLGGPGLDAISRICENTPIPAKTWHHVAIVRRDGRGAVYLDGKLEFRLGFGGYEELIRGHRMCLGGDNAGSGSLEGRLDEIAVYPRALSDEEIQSRVQLSGIEAWREAKRLAARKAAEARAMQLAGPKFDAGYAKAIAALKPRVHWSFEGAGGEGRGVSVGAVVESGVDLNKATTAKANMAAGFRGGRVKTRLKALPMDYSVSVWFRNDQPNNSRAVTGYFFSRGPNGDPTCPGEHLGIGGTYREHLTGKLILFNGNKLDQVVAGRTTIQRGTWNHAVMVRQGGNITVWLNGRKKPEIDTELPRSIDATTTEIFFGGRNDNFANLNGFLDEAAVFDRALSAEEAAKLYSAAGVKAPTPASPAPATVDASVVPLDSQPLSPEAGLKTIHVPEGFVAELVAAEPLVLDPVAIDWGMDGRLWVVEMADYPNGMDDKGKPGGRIRVLTDQDGDGRYDEATLFLDGLNFPTGVMAWKKGALITAAPKIIYAEDSDGDGKADSQKTMYEGFFEGNQQLRVNGLRWGLDNWIYCASGSHRPGYGGKVMIKSHNGKNYEVGSRDFKIRPETGELIPLSGPSQYGRDRDDWGNWFGEQNSYPIWHYVIEDHYLQRNPDAAYESPKKNLTPGNPKVYPAKAPQKRFHSFTQSGRYTSACSAMAYRDELLFPRDEKTHAFTCEPFHNLVQHHVLTEDGVSFKLSRDPSEGELDFFASTDRWCRPVQARTGPDGALWVVDMYRYMIEHPQWLPPNGKEELRPHYRKGEDKGRIYRVYRKDAKPRRIPDLAEKSPTELVAQLGSPNGHLRDLAQRALIKLKERGIKHASVQEAGRALWQVSSSSDNALARLHALCAVEGIGMLAPKTVRYSLDDKHPGVRRMALRFMETLDASDASDPFLNEALDDLGKDPSPAVRLQLALSLGGLEWTILQTAPLELLRRSAQDAYLRSALLSSTGRPFNNLIEATIQAGGVDHPIFPALLETAIRSDNLHLLLKELAGRPGARLDPRRLDILGNWLNSLNRRSWTLDRIAGRGPQSAAAIELVRGALSQARDLAVDPGKDDLRVPAIRLLGRSGSERAVDLSALKGLLDVRQSDSVRAAAIETLVRGWNNGAVDIVAEKWSSLPPSGRAKAVTAFLSKDGVAAALLGAIEAGRVSTSDLTADQRQRLTKHKNKQLRARAAKVLKGSVNADRRKVVESFRPALKLKGDIAKGAEVFARLCAVCHQPPQGDPIGPDLRSITDKSPEGLLVAILDPNQSSDPRYNAYNIDLKDDTSLSGRILSESGASLTVATADGKQHVILRDQIASFSGGRLSLMPEGLEQGVSQQALADVIAYVREGLK